MLNEVRPRALLGIFRRPWSPDHYDGAIRPVWIARQIHCLGELLNIRGTPNEMKRIWPIVQLSDWGDRLPPNKSPPC
jgi:hypothetical protein